MAHCASCHQTTGEDGGEVGDKISDGFFQNDRTKHPKLTSHTEGEDRYLEPRKMPSPQEMALGVHSHRSSRLVFAWMSRLKYSQTRKMYGISYLHLHLINFHAKCRYRDTVTIH